MVDRATLTVADPAAEPARWAMRQYAAELAERGVLTPDVDSWLAGAAVSYAPPRGTFLLAGGPGASRPLGCGALQWLDPGRAEVKRLWVSPAARGLGLGRRLLRGLEELAAGAGRTTVVLDTSRSLTAAIALYEAEGYRRTAPYNDNTDADFWYVKLLAPP